MDLTDWYLLWILIFTGLTWFSNVLRNNKLSKIIYKLSDIEDKICHKTVLYNIRNDLKEIRDSMDRNNG